MAELTLTNRSDGSIAVVELVQQGHVESNDQASLYRIGRGFSCFDDYKCTTSIRGSVISEAKLREFDSGSTFVSVQESMRGEMYDELYSAYSMSEMQSKLTNKVSKSINILGFKKTVEHYSLVSTMESDEQYYGYARLVRVVGSKSIDVGALKYICHNADVVKAGRLPFSDGFNKAYKDINSASGSERTRLIQKMIEEFGTHVVVQTSLGGAIDLAVTYKRDQVERIEETTEKVFKTLTGAAVSSEAMSMVSSSLSKKGAISIYGGSESARQALQRHVTDLSTASSTLSSDLLDNWLESISSHSEQALDAVDFSFIPIWDLFIDNTVSKEILSVVSSMADEQRNVLGDAALGIDNYAIPLDKSLMAFDSKNTTTLVRLLYNDTVPIAEICNEYVPAIRSDKRITVVYPIVNRVSRITMGLFPGDGNYRPAYLTFSGSDVYVNPLDDYGSTDVLDTLFYLHGTLFAVNQGVPLRKSRFTIKNHFMDFRGGNQYPVVKIGSGYWTRSNIKDEMEFGEPFDSEDPDGDYYVYDEVINGIFYANIFYGNSAGFRQSYPGLFDDATDIDGNRIHWYVPRLTDLRKLQSYVGGNCKALLASQQSGFDAQFVGYYGPYDDLNNGRKFTDGAHDVRYYGQHCFIASKENTSSGNALVISPNYTLQLCNTNRQRDNWYPVRPYRSSHYQYPKL